ncbi:MAG: hypothetical protein ABWY25_12595 [Paenisporosarcina sp.]
MVRPITIHEKPNFIPFVCIQCGVGEGRREWFLDLGFAIDHYFDVDNQAIYLCNECYSNLTTTVSRLLMDFRKEHAKWVGSEKPTYNWIEDHDVRESEPIGPDAVPPGYVDLNEGTDTGTDGNDQDPEPDDSEPESPDSGDADTIDDSDTDESDRQAFTAFFGDRGT